MFAEHDYHGTTIDLVARTAGLTRPAVYEFFANKEELFRAVVDDAGRTIGEYYATDTGVALEDDMRGFLRAAVSLLFDFIEQHPEIAVIVRIVDQGALGEASRDVVNIRREIERGVARMMEDGFALVGGLPPEAARVLAAASQALVEAVGFRQPDEPGWDKEQTIDLLTTFLLGGLLRITREIDRYRTFGV